MAMSGPVAAARATLPGTPAAGLRRAHDALHGNRAMQCSTCAIIASETAWASPGIVPNCPAPFRTSLWSVRFPAP